LSENHFDIELDELTYRSVGQLITAERFDAAAFDALEDYIWMKAERLRSDFVLSKQLLKTLRSAAQAIRNRAESLSAARQQLHRADDFDRLLDRLTAGEVRNDRTPGVPRIV